MQSLPSGAWGRVHESGGGRYVVVGEDGRSVEASLRGRIKQEGRTADRLVIGDRVRVAESEGAWTIDEVADRESELVRRGRGGRAPKVLAANLDQVFVIVSLRRPDATDHLVDRLLALVESSGIHPTLVLNKADLAGADETAGRLTPLYEGVGYDVLVTSAESGRGIEALHERICRGVSAFIGPSGVGKSTLLNVIDPSLELRTGGLSRKTGTGRHTTVGSRLIDLACGGLVADTPGFGDVGLWAVDPADVGRCFPELSEYSADCRFRGCTHVHEPACAVRAAVDRGDIARSRYTSYLRLHEESRAASSY